MAKKYIIYANGKDLATCPVTQNEVGRYYWNGNTYYRPTLDIFNNAPLPNGFSVYLNGSHAPYSTNPLRNPIDFSLTAGTKITMNVDVTILSTNPKDGSWCKTVINGTNINPAFVHTYKWASGLVRAGNVICEVAPQSVTGFDPHLHADIWGSYLLRNLILNGDVTMADTFKVGDFVTFTGPMNLRAGAGDGFKASHSILENAVGKIKDGPRSSQNKQFYGKGSTSNINDSYTWFDLEFLDTTGWVAQTNRLVKSKSTKITNVNAALPPVKPQAPSEEETLRKQVADLKEENEVLRDDLAASISLTNDKNREIKRLEADIEEWKGDYSDLQKKYDNIFIEKNRYENLYTEAVRELNDSERVKGIKTAKLIAELLNRMLEFFKKNKSKSKGA